MGSAYIDCCNTRNKIEDIKDKEDKIENVEKIEEVTPVPEPQPTTIDLKETVTPEAKPIKENIQEIPVIKNESNNAKVTTHTSLPEVKSNKQANIVESNTYNQNNISNNTNNKTTSYSNENTTNNNNNSTIKINNNSTTYNNDNYNSNNVSKAPNILTKTNTLTSTTTLEKNINSGLNVNHLSKKGNYLVKVFVDYLEISYKLCDDFGRFFKPFVEINFENQKKILNYSEDKLNTSNLSDLSLANTSMNNSFNLNDLSGMLKTQLNNKEKGKERTFRFKTVIQGLFRKKSSQETSTCLITL